MVRLSGKPTALLTRLPPALSRTIMENASLGKAPLGNSEQAAVISASENWAVFYKGHDI